MQRSDRGRTDSTSDHHQHYQQRDSRRHEPYRSRYDNRQEYRPRYESSYNQYQPPREQPRQDYHRASNRTYNRPSQDHRTQRRPSQDYKLDFNLTEQIEKLDRTLAVQGLSPGVTNEILRQFLIENGIQDVSDVQVVRDNRSGVSRGIAYVEFDGYESVGKVLLLSGREISGRSCLIRKTDAERTQLMKQLKEQPNMQLLPGLTLDAVQKSKAPDPVVKLPTVLSISNVHEALDEDDLREVLEEFGQIKSLQLKDQRLTVDFLKGEDAKEAMVNLNDFELAGQKLRVEYFQERRQVQDHDEL